MSKSTISTFQLFQMFPDAEAARVYMEGKRWPDGAYRPKDKGVAATKMRDQIKKAERKAKREERE